MHLWSDEVIKKIGGSIDLVQKFHYITKQFFDDVEATITLGGKLILHKHVVVNDGVRKYNVFIHEATTSHPSLNYNKNSESEFNASQSQDTDKISDTI